MKNATIRFIIITGMLLKILSVTIYAENALASIFSLTGERSPGESFAHTDTSAVDSSIKSGGMQAALFASNTWILVSPSSGAYTGTVTLSATLRKLIPPTAAVSGKTISFKLDGRSVGSAKTDKNGVATLSDVRLPDDLNAGIHLTAIHAEFAGDANYKKSSGVGALTVTYAPTQLTADNITAPYGSIVTVKATLISSFTGSGLKDKVVTVFINNSPKGMAVTDANGEASLEVPLDDLPVGTYPILVTFLQVIGNYAPNTAHATLKVEKLPTSLSLSASSGTYGGTARLQAALTSSGSPVAGKTVKFTFNGSSYSAQTDAGGIAAVDEVKISGFNAGLYKGIIEAEFYATDIYLASSSTGDLKVEPAPSELNVSNTAGTFGTAASLSATLTSGGTPLSGMNIKFNFNGNSYSGITDATGKVTVNNVSLSGIDAGSYTGAVWASFDGSDNYKAASGSGNLSVNQAPTSLEAVNASGTYGAAADLAARLTSSGAKLSGMTISFTLNGKPVGTALTDNDGQAVLPAVSLEEFNAGTYDNAIRADFLPSGGNYAGSSGTASLKVTLAESKLLLSDAEVYHGSTLNLKAALSSGNKPLSGRTISFTVNNVPKGTALTGIDGTALLENVSLDGLQAGTYNSYLGASFSPSEDNYSASFATANLIVKELPTTLVVNTSTGTFGGVVTLEAVLSSSGLPLVDKTLGFSVNGIPAGSAKTLSNGAASLQFNLSGFNAGFYPGAVKAEFIAADNYAASSASGDLKVNQAPTSLTVADAVGTYSESADLSAALSSGGVPLAGMTLSFKLNGTPVGEALTGTDGIAVIKNVSLSGIDAGEYPGAIAADFQASVNYASSTATGSLKVNQAPALLVIHKAVGTYDGKVTLEAVLTAAKSGIALSGRTLYFKLNGADKGSAVTGTDGLAALPEVSLANIPVGTYESYIEAVFLPSGGNYAPASGKGSLEVGLAPTSISITKITAAFGSKVDLEATLTSYGAPLGGKPVEFRINGLPVGAAVTNAEGKAIKNCISLTGLDAGLHEGAFCASFPEADPYKGSSSTADIEITKACTGVLVRCEEVQYSDQVTLKAVVTSEAQENLNKSGGIIKFKYQLDKGPEQTLGVVSRCQVCDGKLIFNYEFVCSLDPGKYTIFAEFTPSDQVNFNSSNSIAPYCQLQVEPEDALVEYTGQRYFSLPALNSNGASITFSAAITDTADFWRGDISKARVDFREAALGSLYNDWIVQSANLPVVLSNAADKTSGISFSQPFCRSLSHEEKCASGAIFNVYTVVGGNYTKLSAPSLLTIGMPGNEIISGGGFIVPKSTSGKYRGKEGEKTDFGFTMKYDKSSGNCPGQAGLIIRGENGRIYLLKSRAITSSSVYTIDKMPGKAASFSAIAELMDITNPFNQVKLEGNLLLRVEMYVDDKDSKMDAISITLQDAVGELLYSNNWDGLKTIPQNLNLNSGQGTIKVLGSAVISGVDGGEIIPEEYALFQNYPNPFNPSTTIQYDLPEDSRVKIAVYDILGKEITQIVNGEVPAGRHQAVWNSQQGSAFASGIYIVRIAAESLSSKRNLVSSKKMLLIK